MARGQQALFGCSVCRREWYMNGQRGESNLNRGQIDDVDLTGRVKSVPPGRGGMRVCFTRYEYKCRGCGHVGWSRHIDLARLADDKGIEPHPWDNRGLERYRKAQKEKNR